MTEEYDYLFKCIVVGDGGVGKTALTIRFSKGFFTEDYKMTIGVDFHVKTIAIDTEQEGPIKVKLQIWDTGGQERFSSIRPMYYRGSLGSLLIFDLTSYESFEHLPGWIEEVRGNVKNDIPLLLVGNKSDLVEQRAVSMDEINNFTRNFNLYYMETSAKTGDKVGDCFYILACLMVGSGVPEKLIAQGVVFGPGMISAMPVAPEKVAPALRQAEMKPEVGFMPVSGVEPEIEKAFKIPPVSQSMRKLEPEPAPMPEAEPEVEFAAPPVPEREPKIPRESPSISEKEPIFEFAAPPVPEPVKKFEAEPEIEFAAPPVPELKPLKKAEAGPWPVLGKGPEPILESRIPFLAKKKEESLEKEPSAYTTKPPEQALPKSLTMPMAKPVEEKKPSFIPATKVGGAMEPPAYKPKAIPFTASIPVRAPAPQEFKVKETESILEPEAEAGFEGEGEEEAEVEAGSESLVDYMPETILSKKEKKKLEKQKKKEEKEKALQEKREKAAKLKEEMQNVGKQEKERAKLEKQKAREEKQKAKEEKEKQLQEKREKAVKLKEEMQRAGKEKKKAAVDEEPGQPFRASQAGISEQSKSETHNLFERLTLTKKADQMVEPQPSQFIPFGEKQPSKLTIIPNVEDLEASQGQGQGKGEMSGAKPSMGIFDTHQPKEPAARKSNMVICPQCGAMLSSEYAFCNKCGSKI